MSRPATRISLGPLQYHWPRSEMFEFYEGIVECPVDIVYIGETVCSKRRELRHRDWMDIAARLQQAGKEVVFSSLALIEAESELGYLRRACNEGNLLVEANDMAAVHLLAGKAPFVAGPALNINNPRALGRLLDLGLKRWVAPIETTRDVFNSMRNAIDAPVEYELLAWGRMPLAYSARCYTARAHDLNKDDCQNCCIRYPDGLPLHTRDDEEFLVINGIQTMSARTFYRFTEDCDIDIADILRVSPQRHGTQGVLHVLDALRRDDLDTARAIALLEEHAPVGLCNGYWHGQAGMADQRHP